MNKKIIMIKRPATFFGILFVSMLMMGPNQGITQTYHWSDRLNIGAMVQAVPQSNKFIDPGHYVWCGSVTKGKNGKFYMLYSR